MIWPRILVFTSLMLQQPLAFMALSSMEQEFYIPQAKLPVPVGPG